MTQERNNLSTKCMSKPMADCLSDLYVFIVNNCQDKLTDPELKDILDTAEELVIS